MRNKKTKGLALLEVILGVALAAIAIGVLVNLQSGSSYTDRSTAAATEVSVLVNKSLDRAFKAFDSGQYYVVNDKETCTLNFDTGAFACSGINNTPPDLNVSQNYTKQLQSEGITSFQVITTVTAG